ncbi:MULTISPECIES: malonyl-ACP O-methyltransferase BioC [Tenebrionibacter/Tenebrionicola group]|jgi:malonyl-CoA O-methyltransferase|uniref:Malonyl-[acyl-carrier protein] O-methyltransferase n=2 Tax=Tenebrionibacter/Tenebrionicola group TaxID=2969848 RepID=A0A8K0V0U4_9ENTR|nr:MULTISPECIES: malonyl-ACP O-methyltransferase BioC [Tenebrionibacter/Tenebrionicola group]MBK4714536.1 malonyl-ACP O-methyltransferase BioC [Tenebrionibacter intestinalis]MBV4412304.1 malonyl-ACP O-methyltransferase BioC [Tenebrionicola larvae]MBV5095410.1 malonyl-ACP O-methyltransferase BioC [Tenebrionicola larvae]
MSVVNKSAVAAAFGRAATTYDRFAGLQRLCGDRLMQRVAYGAWPEVLDAGCGTGMYSLLWRQRGSRVTALDLSREMLAQARAAGAAHRYLSGDIEALALPDACFDLVWSNLVVQWCGDLARGLRELLRVTRPGGRVAFSTVCDGSLAELTQAWRAVDVYAHTNRFPTLQQIIAASGGRLADFHVERVTLDFTDALSAMRSLKGVGATHLHAGREGRVLTRGQLKALNLAWPKQRGACPLSYRLFYGVLAPG